MKALHSKLTLQPQEMIWSRTLCLLRNKQTASAFKSTNSLPHMKQEILLGNRSALLRVSRLSFTARFPHCSGLQMSLFRNNSFLGLRMHL